jgi:hypothetical protein
MMKQSSKDFLQSPGQPPKQQVRWERKAFNTSCRAAAPTCHVPSQPRCSEVPADCFTHARRCALRFGREKENKVMSPTWALFSGQHPVLWERTTNSQKKIAGFHGFSTVHFGFQPHLWLKVSSDDKWQWGRGWGRPQRLSLSLMSACYGSRGVQLLQTHRHLYHFNGLVNIVTILWMMKQKLKLGIPKFIYRYILWLCREPRVIPASASPSIKQNNYICSWLLTCYETRLVTCVSITR